MINSKVIKLLMNIVIIFNMILLCNVFIYDNKSFAVDSIGDLNSYNGRRWCKLKKTRR